MSEDPQTILVIDDHPLMCKEIVQLVTMEASLRLVGEAGDGQRELDLALQLQPDLILLDLNMRGLSRLRRSWLTRCAMKVSLARWITPG